MNPAGTSSGPLMPGNRHAAWNPLPHRPERRRASATREPAGRTPYAQARYRRHAYGHRLPFDSPGKHRTAYRCQEHGVSGSMAQLPASGLDPGSLAPRALVPRHVPGPNSGLLGGPLERRAVQKRLPPDPASGRNPQAPRQGAPRLVFAGTFDRMIPGTPFRDSRGRWRHRAAASADGPWKARN